MNYNNDISYDNLENGRAEFDNIKTFTDLDTPLKKGDIVQSINDSRIILVVQCADYERNLLFLARVEAYIWSVLFNSNFSVSDSGWERLSDFKKIGTISI